ncbi:hypothetical protein H8E88_18080 [candidate division KSB1 bacterium]|nr:hypothetical protein [candidate division KSB1 bacterium]
MKLVFTELGWDDYLWFQENDLFINLIFCKRKEVKKYIFSLSNNNVKLLPTHICATNSAFS